MGLILQWIVFPFLLMVGVAWFMLLMEGGFLPNSKEKKRISENQKAMNKKIQKYFNTRYKNPLTVEMPLSMEDQHKSWLHDRMKSFESNFFNFDIKTAKIKEPMFKHLKDYQNICKHIKHPQNKKLISEWKKNS